MFSLRSCSYVLRGLGKCTSIRGIFVLENTQHASNYSLGEQFFVTRNQFKPVLIRVFCSSNETNLPLPDLTDIPIYIWPNIINTIRNFFFEKLIIKRYFDKEFNVTDFVEGSKQAVEVVSSIISEGRLKELEGLVTPDVIRQLNGNLKKFSLRQQMELTVKKEDIYSCYPYEIGILMPDEDKDKENKPQERYVEITMSYHVLRGYKAKRDDHQRFLFRPDEFKFDLYVLNYRFVRDYTEGKTSSWIINGLNHFKPMAVIE